MEQAKRILDLLSEGFRPKKIAEICQISLRSVVETISNAVKDRHVLRSEVLATLDESEQEEMAMWFPVWQKLKDKNPEITPQRMFELVKKGLTFELEFEEMLLFFLCFERGFTDGLVYEAVCEIEKTLHTKIRQILIHKYGAPESSWWINGIPCEIREECASRRERDIANFAKNTCYHYTTLGELKTILESKKNCKLFKNHLPCSLHGKEPNMDLFFRDLTTLIGIRNRVMHPIGKVRLTEEDYYFVLDMQKKLDASRWR